MNEENFEELSKMSISYFNRIDNLIDNFTSNNNRNDYKKKIQLIKQIESESYNKNNLQKIYNEISISFKNSNEMFIDSNSRIERIKEHAALKQTRTQERLKIIKSIIKFWDIIGINFEFDDDESSPTYVLKSSHLDNQEYRIKLNINDDNFEVVHIEPKNVEEEFMLLAEDIKKNNGNLSQFMYQIYLLVNENK